MVQLSIQILMTVCIVVYVAIYLVGIKNGSVRPVLATWLFFSLATILSFFTNYRETGIAGLSANAFNMVDTFATFIIFLFVVLKKDTNRKFNKFEDGCLFAVFVIFIVWLLSGQNVLAHLSIQAILVVAYLPTLFHLWKAEKNTESLSMWSFDSLAAMLGTIEPLRTLTFLPLVYGIRAVLSTWAVILLILRLKHKNEKDY